MRKDKGLHFIYTDMENAPQILEVTKVANNYQTVPMIWKVGVGDDMSQPVSNVFIGGYDKLAAHINES